MSQAKLRVLIAGHTNPWFNLATEDYIFRDMDPETHVLYLWRNSPTVVIGRFQNPWSECNLEAMERDGIFLARRQSGGGTVFHDLGNICFTFMSGKVDFNKQRNNSIIINALARLGVKAEASGRNDILVEGRKISGAAFKETKDRSFHHGTLLIQADLSRLANYLNPQKRKLETKGIASVRSRVANLIEFNPKLNHELVYSAVIEEFFNIYGGRVDVEYLDSEKLGKIPALFSYYEKLASWQWRFGETPKFTHHIDLVTSFALFDFHFFVEKGLIKECHIFSDCFDLALIPALQARFQGEAYDRLKVLPDLELALIGPEQRLAIEEIWGQLRPRL